MKHIVESVEEMFHAREPTGEVIIDEVVNAIRCTNTHRSEDIALLLDVDQRELWHSIHMLTGMRLNDIILHWRVLQAKEKWDAQEALFQDYKESIKVKKQEAPEGFVLQGKHQGQETGSPGRLRDDQKDEGCLSLQRQHQVSR